MPARSMQVMASHVADLGGRRTVGRSDGQSKTWGLSQADAALLLGVSREVIGQWRPDSVH